ncbi:MAG: hypothetical protein ACM3PE_12815 [Deltaproteobacteria bacterium]
MNKKIYTWCFIALAMISLLTGYQYASHLKHSIFQKPSKTAVIVQKSGEVVKSDTRIILEKEYKSCGHVIVTGYNMRENIMGLNIRQLNDYFKKSQGYSISFINNTLIIHQSINDNCPEDQNQFKLKEYRGYVAVYTGAEENEILLRVTAIRSDMLPENIRRDIQTGKYTFQDEAKLNDTLENLDEYV